MRSLLFGLVSSFLVGLVLTPAVRRVALRVGALDKAGVESRKIHVEDVPRLGGIAIVAAFFAPVLVFMTVDTGLWRQVEAGRTPVGPLLLGALAVALLGLYDDLRGARPRVKLVVQILAAGAMYLAGFSIAAIDLPFLPAIHFGWLSMPITILWIVGVTNAVNLIDGLDGLAAGVALLGVTPVVVAGIAGAESLIGLIGVCLIGALLAFLTYNWHPARIFMGDTGSMFLGFVLAVLTLHTSQKGPATASMLAPILALGVPIMDTLLAIARRAWVGMPIFGADRDHVHHRLRNQGYSQRRAVSVLYLVSLAFVVGSVMLQFRRNDLEGALALVGCMMVAVLLMRHIGYLNIEDRPLREQIRQAALFRAENQFLRRQVSRTLESLETATNLDELATRLGPALRSFGVSEAQMTLFPTEPSAPERSWRWELPDQFESDADLSQESTLLNLGDEHGEPVGEMRILLYKEEQALRVQIPLLESLVRAIGPRVRRLETDSGSAAGGRLIILGS